MSAAEIIDQLPKLTDAELRLVRQRLVEIAAQNQDIELCDQAALDGAVMLDRMEDDDARRQSREVWIIDFGMTAKVRPALLLTGTPADDELDIVTVLLHTTAVPGLARGPALFQHPVADRLPREITHHAAFPLSSPAPYGYSALR